MELALRAANRASEQGAFEIAARHFEQALAAVRQIDPPGSRREATLLVAIAEAHCRAGEQRKAAEVALQAGVLAGCSDHPDLLARAALAGRGSTARLLQPDPRVVRLLEAALDALPLEPTPLRALVQSRLAASFSVADQGGLRRLALSDSAVAIARGLGDVELLRTVLEDRHVALRFPGGLERRMRTAAELVRLAEASGRRETLAIALAARVADRTERCDMAAAAHDVAACAASAAEIGHPELEWHTLAWRAMEAQVQGRWEEAHRLAHDAFFVGRHIDEPLATFTLACQIVVLSLVRGRIDEVFVQLQLMTQLFPQFPVLRAIQAQAYLLGGRTAEARAECERVLTGGFARLGWGSTTLLLLASLGIVYARLGDLPRCAEIHDRLLPYRDLNITTGLFATVSFGPVARVLGIIAGVLERWDEAEAHFQNAIRLCEALGSPPWTAFTKFAWGLVLMARNRPGDGAQATLLLTDASRVARDCGMSRRLVEGLRGNLLVQTGWTQVAGRGRARR